MKKSVGMFVCLSLLISASLVSAQVPSLLNYQGRVTVDGTNFDGTAQFSFALVDGGSNLSHQATATATVSGGFMTIVTVDSGGSGYVTVPAVSFSGGGGSGAAAHAQLGVDSVTNIVVDNVGSNYVFAPVVIIEPPPPNMSYQVLWTNGAPMNVSVVKGLYSVTLGDTELANMAAVPPEIFTNSDVRLRVSFDDGVHGEEELLPYTRIVAAGYSMMAANVQDGVITSEKLADGAVLEENLADDAVTADKIANTAVDTAQLAAESVTSAKIEDGSISAADVDAASFSNTFWKVNGNAGTRPAVHFMGTTDNRALELRVNGSRALRIDPTIASPRWAAGYSGNVAAGSGASVLSGGSAAEGANKSLATYSVICGGVTNVIATSSDYSIIGGGMDNSIDTSSQYNFIGGGNENTINDSSDSSVICCGSGNEMEHNVDCSFIGCGEDNTIHTNSDTSVIAGGSLNEITGGACSVGGGRLNKIKWYSFYSCIAGGVGNKINNSVHDGFIGAGYYNTIESDTTDATISGGRENTIGEDTWGATIPGGRGNEIASDADYAFAAGRRAKALYPGSFIWADSQDADFSSTATNEVAERMHLIRR